MHKPRRHSALFFILCLLALSVPREWLHHHDADEHIFAHAHSESGVSGDCAVCDFDFTADEPATVLIPCPVVQIISEAGPEHICFTDILSQDPVNNKAPPVTSRV